MWRPYRDAAAAVLPEATGVVDKFHVVRMLNAACETVRKALRADLSPAERRGLVNDCFLILKRKHRLNGKEYMMLSGWLENYPALAMAYEIIPPLLQNPKFLVRYDPEVVRHLAAEGFPLVRDGFAEELEDRTRELLLRRIVAIMGHELVHHSP